MEAFDNLGPCVGGSPRARMVRYRSRNGSVLGDDALRGVAVPWLP